VSESLQPENARMQTASRSVAELCSAWTGEALVPTRAMGNAGLIYRCG
jgi:hypothetical protein